MPLGSGLSAVVMLEVSDADTALAFGSGDVPVLATPRVVALVEQATCQALAGQLQPGQTHVGMRVQLDHVHPSPVGSTVKAEVRLDKVEGRRLVFGVSVTDARGLIAAGKVTRVVVDQTRFLDRAI